MVLTPSNLVHLLVEREFVTAESVVDGRFVACESSRRQRSYKVVRRGLPGYFVKQVKRWDDDRTSAIEREADCYRLARDDPEFAALAAILPQCYAYDPDLDLLIAELLDGVDLRRLYQHDVCPELDILLAETLASYHRELRGPVSGRLRGEFRETLPGAFTMHRRGDAPFLETSEGQRELVKMMGAERELGEAVDRLAQLWRAETLIHGDMKWTNCLMVGGANPCLKIVDWEMSDFGDPLWDAGALLQEYFRCGLEIGNWESAGSAADMRLAARRFWDSYEAAVGAHVDLGKAFGFGAVRLLQSAWENLQSSDTLTAASVQMVQAAANILDDPARAAGEFLDGD